jgi:pyruvate/2-oxoglutarate dehydrogenase complex dihydrolipoamide acyltransferase (E2) component
LPNRRIAEAPVVSNGQNIARLMSHLWLSYDRRIIGGETAIKFLQRVRAGLEAAKFEMG